MIGTLMVEKMNSDNLVAKVADRERFKFGDNWKRFLKTLTDERIHQAEAFLKEMLERDTLDGRRFLDIGSGSGLFSLAARNLGAEVVSFDYDSSSVWCANALKERYYESDHKWTVNQGSVLDTEFLRQLGEFDIVYSWGVLHHTGDMWAALGNVVNNVKEEGQLFIALYNRQRFFSRYWKFVKVTYNRYRLARPLWIVLHGLYPTLPSVLLKAIQRRKVPRGMATWYDLLDWLGGYPFEVSTPQEVFNFYKQRGFQLTQIKTVGGKLGCNEYVFRKS